MIVNYDKDIGWSSILDNFKVSPSQEALDFFDLLNTDDSKSYMKWDASELVNYAKGLDVADESLINFLNDTSYGEKSLASYQSYLNKTSSVTSKFSSFTAKAGSAIKTLGSTIGASLLNMGIGMAVGAGVSLIFTAIDDYIHKSEKLIEAGEEAQSSIQSTFDEFSTQRDGLIELGKSFSDNASEITNTGSAIDAVASKYTELSKGVNSLTNANQSLSADEYQSYLDISNQIADQFPSLISGYDAQGNAILNMGSSADSAAESMTRLYEAQMLTARAEIGGQLNDAYAGISEQISVYEEEIAQNNKKIEDIRSSAQASLKSSAEMFNTGHLMVSDAGVIDEDTMDKIQSDIENIITEHGFEAKISTSALTNTFTVDTNGLNAPTRDAIEEYLSEYEQYFEDAANAEIAPLLQQNQANEQLIKDQWNAMAESLGSYLQTSKTFTDLNEDLQNAFLGNLSEIDASKIGEDYAGNVEQFLYGEFLIPLSNMKPEAQQALSDLLKFDPGNMNIDEYSDLVNAALYNAFPNDKDIQEQMRKSFGFDSAIEEAETQLNYLKNIFGDAVDDLTFDEIEQGYDLVVNGDDAINTVDELRNKIEETKALAATSVDLDVRTGMDAIEAAQESANAGADYESMVTNLEKAKELFDKGFIGTDDFKSIASYLSPTGADDAVNFAENYAKAARYLTEDGQGVQNFLEDLESHDFANLETLSDGTQQWTYDIEDLEQAASDMGIGFEFMMDMFGRLEDYGFSNNFVGSVEDGQARLTDLATQLAQEEAELARLQAKDADTTAIEQQQAKVNALKNDIEETTAAMSQLISKSAADYNEEINVAKTTLETLAAERQKILDDRSLFGGNTDLIANKLEEEMQSIANEYGIELDADLNIKEPESPPEITVQANIDSDYLNQQLEAIGSGESVSFQTTVNGDLADVKALKNENGTITYTAIIDGVETTLKSIEHEDGTVTFVPDTTEVDEEAAKTDGGERTTSFKAETSDVDAESSKTDGGVRSVIYGAVTSNLPNSFPPITRTVNYVVGGVTGGVKSALSGDFLSGTAHLSGSLNGLYPIPHLSGRALAMGTLQDETWLNPKWRTKHTEVALTGEEAPELVATRANRWYLVGKDGAEFAKIPQGSVVFNAEQTKELLSNGKINSRGTAMIGGTAYAGGSGGGGFFIGGSGSSSGMSGAPASSPLGSSTNTASNAAKSAEKVADSVSKAAEEFKEKFDEIEILLSRMDRALNKLTDSIETYSYDLSKQSAVSDQAMNTIRNNLTALQSAYNRYIQEANSVGLSDDWKRRVENGEIDITTITDESLMDKINEYQQWLRISGHLIYFIAGTSPQPCFATT